MDFDRIIDRQNTDSLKYDFIKKWGKPEGVLPLWVADMDFRTPSCVIDALLEKCRHGIFGYSETRNDYYETLRNWFSSRFNWSIRPEWLVKTPGVVFAICTAIRALTDEGDAILVQQPVYSPFFEMILENKRKLITNQLVYSQGKYSIDFSDFEDKIIKSNAKLFILCSPHNPVGRVWTLEELLRLGEICLKHDVTVVSDEIHADFTYPGHRHLVFADVKPEFSDITVTCTSPTKTFNLAGLHISNIFIANRDIRRKFKKELEKSGHSLSNIMGITACRAAYEGGSNWLIELNKYLSGNLDLLRSFLKQKLPQIKLIEPEGTYLVWLDFSALGLDDKKLEDFILNEAGLWLDSGTMFGIGGEGFQRINIACPRSVLEKALIQLEQAILSRFN
jgi:cystathionine beta-lyase